MQHPETRPTNRFPFFRSTLTGLCLLALAAAADAQSQRYRFKLLLDSTPAHAGFLAPAIDESGRVVVEVQQPRQIVRTDGSLLETVADLSGPIASFKYSHVWLQMNAGGTVAFCGTLDAGGEAIYTWDGTNLREVMRSDSMPAPSNAPGVFFYDLSINESGAVACWARGPAEAVFLNDGTTTRLVTQNYRSPNGSDWFEVGHLQLLDDNSLVMLARRDEYSTDLLRYGFERMASTGVSMGTLATEISPQTSARNASFFWSANNRAEVIYRGGHDVNSTTVAGANRNGQFVIATQQPPSPWTSLGTAALAQSGRYAISGSRNGYVLADGPDPVRDRVLGQGDVLFGQTVYYAEHLGRHSINSFGQICLVVTFTNGARALVRADPRIGARAR